MAEPFTRPVPAPDPNAPPPAPKRVAVLDPQGRFGTVDEADVPNLPMGARVLSRKEIAQRESDEAYDQKSLAEKATSLASMAGPVPFAVRAGVKLAQGKGDEVVPALPPTLEAYKQGVSQGFTGGLGTAAEHEAVRALGGNQAARAYAKNVENVTSAHPLAHGAGEVAGFAGSAVAGGPIGELGGAAEQAATRGLAGVAERGVLGRALATGGALGARGAAEGAVYGAANRISEDMLGDRELAADKIFAAMGHGALTGGVGGAALGSLGSLAASGGRAAVGGAGSALSRVLSKGEEATSDIFAKGGEQAARDLAADSAFRATGARKAFVQEANTFVDGGTKSVGQTLLKHGIISADDGIARGIIQGTPEGMLPKLDAALEKVGAKIGDLTGASPATVTAADIGKAVSEVTSKYYKTAATAPAADSLASYTQRLIQSLGITTLEDTVPVAKLLDERRALSQVVFEGPGAINPGLQKQIKQDLARKLEDLITKSLDEASGKATGELAAEYKLLKRDYQGLRIARDAVEDSIDRGTANRRFSLTDKIIGGGISSAFGAVGTAIGGPIGAAAGLAAGPAAAYVSKMVRTRGDAAMALLFSRLADMGAAARVVTTIDEMINGASKGVLQAPKAKRLPEAFTDEPVRARATRTVERVAQWRADPEGSADRIARITEPMQSTAPNLAAGVASRMTTAMAFMASKVPEQPPSSPLDPRPPMRLSDSEATKLARYDWYSERPERFFAEAAHGKITPEGVEVARTLMPNAFADLQTRVTDRLADLMARGVAPPRLQRERLGLLLDIPVVASQRDEHMVFLQSSAQPLATMQESASPPKRPLPNSPSTNDGLDRIEGR